MKQPKAKPQYRHELKYYLNQGDYALLSGRLKNTMAQDEFAAKNGGEYFIRSLYFDDYDDTALRDKLAGEDVRDKFRLRTYNMLDDVIKLECKHKKDGFICKRSLSLSRRECDMLLAGDTRFLLKRPEPFAQRMFAEFATRGLRPVVLVDYMREAYVFPYQDVRVTFDKDIRTGYRSVDIFDPNVLTYRVVEGFDMVLEVKFNEYLPAYLRELLQCDAHIRSAISKYCLCRKFEL
ncbi:MAG: polyphosphate polymerase domain-containing protein [Christensenellaceae bacterium]|jgi:SPX domain protein involved in polyphosphate accumulation|nr:polyphosphate polymerase domain-containing protein [Christensenellaceae bacterium]